MEYYRRSDAEMLADTPIIAEMFLRGVIHGKIAEHLCEIREKDNYITRTTVTRHIKKIVKAWKERENEFISDRMLIELAKIDRLEVEQWNIYDELMEAWRMSKEFVKQVQKQIGVKDNTNQPRNDNEEEENLPDKMTQETVTEIIPGDVKYIREARNTLDSISKLGERRARLLGFEKIKLELEGGLSIKSKTQNTVINIMPSFPQTEKQHSNLPKSLLQFDEAEIIDNNE